MVRSNEYLYSRFPEALFGVEDNGLYINSLACGLEVTSKLNVVITGLCKNIAPVLDHTIARLYKTSSYFNSCKFGKNHATVEQAWRQLFDDTYTYETMPPVPNQDITSSDNIYSTTGASSFAPKGEMRKPNVRLK